MAENKHDAAQQEQEIVDAAVAETANDAALDEQQAAEGGASSTPQAQIEGLQLQLEQAKEQALRALADTQNARRRAEKDVESAHKFALDKFCNALLPVVDNLERAQQAADVSDDEAVKSILQGVELTHKSFIDVLNKFNLEQVDPLGEPFDPQFHQAITMVENPDAEPNSVLDVMQKGYILNGRLIRPAMVVVSKAPTAKIDETA